MCWGATCMYHMQPICQYCRGFLVCVITQKCICFWNLLKYAAYMQIGLGESSVDYVIVKFGDFIVHRSFVLYTHANFLAGVEYQSD
jgi:hypothetical protein